MGELFSWKIRQRAMQEGRLGEKDEEKSVIFLSNSCNIIKNDLE